MRLKEAQIHDVHQLMRYRPERFGYPSLAWVREVKQGSPEWSWAELELVSAFVARLGKCSSCALQRGANAEEALGCELVGAVMDDWSNAELSDKLRATLGFVERLTLEPGSVGPEHVAPMRAAGLGKGAIRQVVHFCAMVSTISRIASALDFALPQDPHSLS